MLNVFFTSPASLSGHVIADENVELNLCYYEPHLDDEGLNNEIHYYPKPFSYLFALSFCPEITVKLITNTSGMSFDISGRQNKATRIILAVFYAFLAVFQLAFSCLTINSGLLTILFPGLIPAIMALFLFLMYSIVQKCVFSSFTREFKSIICKKANNTL